MVEGGDAKRVVVRGAQPPLVCTNETSYLREGSKFECKIE